MSTCGFKTMYERKTKLNWPWLIAVTVFLLGLSHAQSADCITNGVWDCRSGGTCPDSWVDEEVCSMPDPNWKILMLEESNDLMGLRITYRHDSDIFTNPDFTCTLGDW